MKLLIASLVAAAALAGMASCASGYGGNDGISRFADGGTYGPYYGPGSLPRDGSEGSPHA
ncbi:MAG TPA: hypothetical protein VGO52_08835 [Hyphomonadaceae bacterium]|jgi:hypothetical protein|nr:hypothetical protein [Hyphomonadaceae bacterium]